jgi:hypothetical protein
MAKKSPETIELDALTKKLEDAISGSDKKSKSERYTEDLFKGFFESVDIGLRADRDDVPSIKTPTGTWRPDGVVRSADAKIYEVFELKKPSVKICVDQSANYPAASAIFQAVRYIAASHTYKSTKEIKRVFCFNGIDLLCVSPVSDEQLKLFLNRSPWKDTIGKDDLETEKILKASCALVEAYFKFEYLASLPSHEDVKDKLLFRHQVRHFSDSLLRAIGIETSVVRATITKANLKEIYEEFCSLVTKKPEEHFVRIAPVWTRNNLFWFGKNGFLHVFQKDGTKVCDIPRGDIKNQDLDAVKRLLECHVLDSPETFYDNYDTLLKPEVRKRLGSYFTKKGLAGFAQFFIAEKIGNLSEFYILDPAAGSGTLLANLKAKSVFGTDIHQFKYSLMRQRGVRHFSKPIDFLNTQPEAYVSMLNEATDGDVVKKPLLVLSNPPYLGHSSPDDLESTLKAEVKNSKMMSNLHSAV